MKPYITASGPGDCEGLFIPCFMSAFHQWPVLHVLGAPRRSWVLHPSMSLSLIQKYTWSASIGCSRSRTPLIFFDIYLKTSQAKHHSTLWKLNMPSLPLFSFYLSVFLSTVQSTNVSVPSSSCFLFLCRVLCASLQSLGELLLGQAPFRSFRSALEVQFASPSYPLGCVAKLKSSPTTFPLPPGHGEHLPQPCIHLAHGHIAMLQPEDSSRRIF